MIRGYLLDLDGTVYRGERLISGADQAIALLRARGRRIVFLSINPSPPARITPRSSVRLGFPPRRTT